MLNLLRDTADPLEPPVVEGRMYLAADGTVVVEGYFWETDGQYNHTMMRAMLLLHSGDHRKYWAAE